MLGEDFGEAFGRLGEDSGAQDGPKKQEERRKKQQKRCKKREGRTNTKEARREKEETTRHEKKQKKIDTRTSDQPLLAAPYDLSSNNNK